MQSQLSNVIPLMLLKGMEINVERPNKQTKEFDVFGGYAGQTAGNFETFTTKIVYSEPYFETEGFIGATFLDKIYLFSEVPLYEGDILTIPRTNGTSKKYKIMPTEIAGITRNVVTRYQAMALES